MLEPARLPSHGHDLTACLGQMVDGFEAVHEATGRVAVALSFAFPGPADYAAGIIGDLPNLPAFRGGVPEGDRGHRRRRRAWPRRAACAAWRALGAAAGDAIASAMALVDGLVVLGGGLSAAAPHLLPALMEALRCDLQWWDGRRVPRMLAEPSNLEDPRERAAFMQGEVRRLPVGTGGRTVPYDARHRTGVRLSRLGTSEAMSLGAYAFALDQMGRAGDV